MDKRRAVPFLELELPQSRRWWRAPRPAETRLGLRMEKEQDQCRQVEISRRPGRRSGCSAPPRRAGAAPRRRRRPGCRAAATADVHARSSLVAHPLPRRHGRRRRPWSPGRPTHPNSATRRRWCCQLAASGELLHRRLSRNQPRELDLVAQHDMRRLVQSTSRSRGGASRLRRGPPKHDGRRESENGNCGADAHGPPYHGTETPAPCATVDRFGVGDGTGTG